MIQEGWQPGPMGSDCPGTSVGGMINQWPVSALPGPLGSDWSGTSVAGFFKKPGSK